MALFEPITARNLSYLSVAQLLSSVFGFVTLTVLSRALGPAHFGILGFGTAVLGLLGILTTLGSDQFGAREISRAPNTAGTITLRLLRMRLILAILAYGVLILFDISTARGVLESKVLLIQGIGVFVTAFTIDYLFQGMRLMGWIASRQIATAALIMIASIIAVHSPEDLIKAAWIYLITGGFVALIILVKGFQSVSNLQIRDPTLNFRKIFIPMLTMAVAGAMQAVILNTDLIMLGIIRSHEEVGLYTAAVRIGMLALIPAGLVVSALFPDLALHPAETDQRLRVARRFTGILLFMGLPLPFFVMIQPRPVLGVIFGEDFLIGANVLVFMMMTTLLAHLRLSLDTPLIAWNWERQVMKLTIIGASANILMNAALIPSFGMLGAVSASLASQIIMTIGCGYFYRLRVKNLPLIESFRVFICAGISCSITAGLVDILSLDKLAAALQLFITGSLFGIFYLTIGYVLIWRPLRNST